MDKSETPWKRSVLEMLKMEKSVALMPSEKNPANCDLEASILQVPPTPLVKTLGHGTGVQVFVVKRNLMTEERSPWAIKMLSARNDPSKRALLDKRLSEEAVVLRKLNHPNIIGFRSFETVDVGRSILALEYANSSLGDILEERYNKGAGPLEAYKGKRMTIDVLRGLVYLHEEAHILHGDLKSFNILIKQDFQCAKLCDFGVSVPLNSEGYIDLVKNPDARYIGTALWSPPEVFQNQPSAISVKADIFALGMVLYEILTLTPPHTFPGIMDETITESASVACRRLDMSLDEEIQDEESAECDDVPEAHSMDEEEINALCTEIVESHKRTLADDEEHNSSKKPKTTSDESIAASGSDDVQRDDEEGGPNPPIPVVDNAVDNGEEPTPEASALPIPELEEEVISISSDDSVDQHEKFTEIIDDHSEADFEDEVYEDEDEFALQDDVEDEYEEDDYYEEGQYLNYAVLGSRPPLPCTIDINDDHLPLVEMFHLCTEILPSDRPTARQLLDALSKTMASEGEPDGAETPTNRVDNKTEPCQAAATAVSAADEPESEISSSYTRR